MTQPYPQDVQPNAQTRTPYRPNKTKKPSDASARNQQPMVESPLKQRPKTARQVKEEQR